MNNKPSLNFIINIDKFWLGCLSFASLLLYTIDLGILPLRDWDEGIVAQVAREMGRGAGQRWLYPVLGEGPYLNKPPLIHWLISLTFQMGGINEWTARLAPAIITALSVPILYAIAVELTPLVRDETETKSPFGIADHIGLNLRLFAVFSSCVYLTLLPIARHGRLAMLDGSIVTFFLAFIWFILRSRRDLRYALGAGISIACISLTKGVMVGILLGAIGFIFLFWDTPRLLTSPFFLGGIFLGNLPVIWWYLAQWSHYGQMFLNTNLFNQSFQRVWQTVGNHAGPPWYYLVELLEYSWPWLIFAPKGIRLSWENRNFSWGKLILVWFTVYLVAISLMTTKLPWYILPIYPALALAIGAQLAMLWQQGSRLKLWESNVVYPRTWLVVFSCLAVLGWIGLIAGQDILDWGKVSIMIDSDLKVILGLIALTMTIASILVYRSDRQFIIILFWGLYLSLLLFFNTQYWVWELGEDYPVKPVAALVQKFTPVGERVYSSHRFSRPSLNFYSDRLIKTAKIGELKTVWEKSDRPYFLVDQKTLDQLQVTRPKILGSTNNWLLVTKDLKKL